MRAAILARHGESVFSARAAVNGDAAVACPLTAAGEEQARRLGRLLEGEAIDLCVTTEFERTRGTAELALAGRDVPRLVLPELNDPRVGSFEGGTLDEYRSWAWESGAAAEPPGGGESRVALARRYASGLRRVLDRPEQTVLVVAHALPIAYALAAAEGVDPAPRIDREIAYAEPYRLDEAELRAAAARLAAWSAQPTW